MDTIDRIRKSELRVTPQRIQVLEVFEQFDHAISSQLIEDTLSGIDRITLYRTLKSFEEKGLIHKVVDGTGISKFALCEDVCTDHGHHHDHHLHFHCKSCQTTTCLDHVTMPKIELPRTYQVEDINIIIQGTCQKCIR